MNLKSTLIAASVLFTGSPSMLGASYTSVVEPTTGEGIIQMSELDLSPITYFHDNGKTGVRANLTTNTQSDDPIVMKGVWYKSGVGTHATSKAVIKLNGATRFHSVLGVDDDAQNIAEHGIVDYTVTLYKDRQPEVIASGTLTRASGATGVKTIDLDVTGYDYLMLDYDQGVQPWADHVAWADARFNYSGAKPRTVAEDDMYAESGVDASILTCPTTMFSQPGVRFMHKIRTSNPAAELSVSNLPSGLEWNERRNLVEGIVETEGDYTYNIVITLEGETAEVPVSLKVSSNLQQPVPFMGWLSWNVVQDEISESVIRTVADAMVSQGLADAGYNYLVIDDLWHAAAREAGTGKPLPDASKFPNGMKVCADYVHDKGLKFGIYSDAAELTCAKAYGSYGFETVDANQYAAWGVDLLKYDYCSAPTDQATAKKRYKAMGDALKASGRDILFYMCEWGVREPWKWAAETGASCWRCTYDTRDGWNGMTQYNGIGIVQSVEGMKDLWPYNGVNRFNDADMMCVGIHGTGKSSNDLVYKAGMTMTEYRTQFALWCLWSSPLTLSFDLRKSITDEDLELMTNKELIAINQDRMGQAAELIYEQANGIYLFAKDLENGDVAVGVLNMSSAAKSYTVNFSEIPALDASATYSVRDLCAHADLEAATGSMAIDGIAAHETKVYRLSKNDLGSIAAPDVADAVNRMTVADDGESLKVCVPGTEGAAKRLLVSDLNGRVLTATSGSGECFTVARPSGVVVIEVVCAGHAHRVKYIVH